MEAIKFAKKYTFIEDSEIDTIMHACKSILSYDGRVWRKKNEQDLYDIPMGSFHGAEVCDLVGLHILSKLSSILPRENVGLYRDDGLAIID